MIKRSIRENKYQPFFLKPVGKSYLWGGTRLKEDFSKDMDMSPLAESWECSIHPDGLSMIDSGVFAGKSLKSVLQDYPELLGKKKVCNHELPFLIKLIDADKDLSVQVHPDDDYADKFENGQYGKSEMWYVLDAEENARIIYGFYHDVQKEEIEDSIRNGTIEKYLQKIPVKQNDVFFVKPGIVHAIGAGTLIAEIQQNSNLTYRLYDYERVGADGRKRELHIDKALDVMCLNGSEKPRQPMRILRYYKGYALELLCQCMYFRVERLLLNTENNKDISQFEIDKDEFCVLLCIKGCGVVFGEEVNLRFFKGDSIFIPANRPILRLHGVAEFLKISC